MPTLDHPHPTRSPDIWTGDRVRVRLIEACETYRKLPIERFDTRSRSSSGWAWTPLHDWQDQVHWNNPGDTARDRKWKSWEQHGGASPTEISRMEEAFGWLIWLKLDTRKKLEAFVWKKATGINIRPILGRQRIAKTTFYRDVSNATQTIALRLNGQGVQVR